MSDTPTAPAVRSLFIRIGNFFFHYRNSLFPILFVFLVLFPPAQFGNSHRLDMIAIVLGIAMALFGQFVRCATIGLVYIQRGGKNGRIYASDLVTEGIYAHTRNPMYLGNMSMAAGLCILYGLPLMYAIALVFFLIVYLSITLAEENYLRGQFGDQYDAYCKTTNRYWPRLKGLGQTLSQHRFEWKYVVNKEYGTLFALCLGLYAIMVRKYYGIYAPAKMPERPLLLAIPLIPLIILYGIARWMKKTGRLESKTQDQSA